MIETTYSCCCCYCSVVDIDNKIRVCYPRTYTRQSRFQINKKRRKHTVITMILRQVNSPTALGQRYLRVFIRQIVKDRDILGADFRQGVSRGLWTAGKGQRKVRQSPRSPRQEVVAFEHTFATFVASLYFVQSLPNQPNQAPIPNNLIYHLSTRGRPACASSPPCAPRGGPGRGRPL